ncbi:hypothetical protein BT93_B0970 [Corymbia citriodora subsp. variegata]|nr:hypothetical protein BT93_B0970 [Corymbia citriodora subsp. variegata]
MGLTQWMDWMEAEREACTTEEGFESLILKYEAVQDLVRNKLKSMEDKSKVEVGAGESRMLTEEEMDALFDSLSRCPALSDLMTDGDGDGIPPQNSDGGGSVAMESTPALSVGGGSSGVASAPTSAGLEDQGFDPDELLNLLEDGDHEDNGFDPSNLLEDGDHEDDGFDPDEFLILLEDGDMDGGRKGSSTSPEDSAVVGCGYNPDDFVGLGDLDVLL